MPSFKLHLNESKAQDASTAKMTASSMVRTAPPCKGPKGTYVLKLDKREEAVDMERREEEA